MTQAKHDPGGKTRLRLPNGITGDAAFSECGRYRHWLSRDWTPTGEMPKTILFIGLNPSVADAEASDPTCHREMVFSQTWGFTRYLKGNLMDWRATSPRDLPPDPQLARSVVNLETLNTLCTQSSRIVLASGNVHRLYADIETETIALLRNSGRPIFCFGRNKSGATKHPLYLRSDSTLEPL